MRRWYFLLAGFLLLLLLPSQGREIGELKPIGLLCVTKEAGVYVVRTDTDDVGTADDPAGALADLQATCPGTVFLDTVQYLLADQASLQQLPKLSQELRPTVRVCIIESAVNPEAAFAYLSAHKPSATLQNMRMEAAVPQWLKEEKERFYLA